MDTIKILVGSIIAMSNATNDRTREVEFEGMELAELREFGMGRGGAPIDTRGTKETLYKTADGRLIVHMENWSHWQGEPTTYSLHEATEADLDANGRFETLGLEAGYGRPLTLDEALS